MRRRAWATATVVVPITGLALTPATDNSPSGASVLRLLPSGLLAAAWPRARNQKTAHSYEVLVTNVAGSSCDVHLCGTSHINSSSTAAARTAVQRAHGDGALAAVALECDSQTLSLLRCAHEAIAGLTPEVVRTNGVTLVRAALFLSPTVQRMAAQAGTSLDTPATIGLPPPILRHLTSDGVLWSDEMRAAADAADESGARIVCLGIDAPTAASSPPPPAVPMLGMVACWLRAHALRPALLDERGCDADDIAAMNTAMRETLPALHARKLVDVDDRIAQKLLTLCAQMGNDDAGVDAKRSIIPRAVVVVVGAQHVPGLEARLKTSRK